MAVSTRTANPVLEHVAVRALHSVARPQPRITLAPPMTGRGLVAPTRRGVATERGGRVAESTRAAVPVLGHMLPPGMHSMARPQLPRYHPPSNGDGARRRGRTGRPSGAIGAHRVSGPGTHVGSRVAFDGAPPAPQHPGAANDRTRPGSATGARRRDREGCAGGGIDARRDCGPGAHVAPRDAFDGASTAPQVPPRYRPGTMYLGVPGMYLGGTIHRPMATGRGVTCA